jgi:hypothetical protein
MMLLRCCTIQAHLEMMKISREFENWPKIVS